MKNRKNRVYKSFLVLLLLLFLCSGCGNREGQTKIVLTTGLGKDEVFRVEDISCKLPEIMVYLTNTQNQYESIFGPDIWNTNVDGVTLEENVKDTVLAQIAQIKTMNLLAQYYQISLEEEEIQRVDAAASTYFSSLSEQEITLLGITQETIKQLYNEYAIADKVYEFLIRDINPEISDDEARIITVEHVLIKTYAQDGTGKKIAYSEEKKQEAYGRAQQVLALAKDEANNNFQDLIKNYSEDSIGTYSFGKGEMDPSFEEAAFNLETGEISEIVESQLGYHVIKCITTFDKEETDANKLKIVEQRKKEVFGEKYDNFVASLTRKLNEELWDQVTFIHDAGVTTSDFFDVYTQAEILQKF